VVRWLSSSSKRANGVTSLVGGFDSHALLPVLAKVTAGVWCAFFKAIELPCPCKETVKFVLTFIVDRNKQYGMATIEK